MRVRLKGLHSAGATLADGRRVVYWYAWRGGPRLPGQPGSPEFIAAHAEALRGEARSYGATLGGLLDRFQDSREFPTNERTAADYRRHLDAVRREFGDMTLSDLEARGSRGLFLEWREEIANERGARTADYVFAILARALSWAVDREILSRNPCARAGRLHDATRREFTWSLPEEQSILAETDGGLRLAILLALWTAQRQGDILKLAWSAYDGQSLLFRQGKTKMRLRLPVAGPLKTALDQAFETKTSPIIVTGSRGSRPYTSDGFRASFDAARQRAGLGHLNFHDFRGTFATRASEAGATKAETRAITGHAGDGGALETNYLSLTYAMAQSCIRKVEDWHEKGTELTKRITKRSTGSNQNVG